MLARLWWKEARIFWPIWLILGLVAVGIQWLVSGVPGPGARSGALTPVALAWAVLYAFVAGSAAFAGERETKTLGLLDTLPVGRGTLWLGKASFAVVSTLGLALVLVGLAALGTTETRNSQNYGYGVLARTFGTLMFEGIAWGLFWSALLANPLVAGGLAVASVGAAAAVVNLAESSRNFITATDFFGSEPGPGRVVMALGALAGSAVVLTWVPRPRRRFGVGWWPKRRPATGSVLAWQTRREGQGIWFALMAIGVIDPVVVALLNGGNGGAPDRFGAGLLAVVVCLVAGVGVFGVENATGNRRFLLHQGVLPGQVWRSKMLVWGGGMALFGLVFFGVAHRLGQESGSPRPSANWMTNRDRVIVGAVLADAFALGLLGGMVFQRRITGGLVAVLGMVVLVPVQLMLVATGMIPVGGLLLTPLILLGITRAWAGDWLADRDGFRPWARLALLVIVPFGLLGSAYIAYRAYSLPYQPPLADPAAAPVAIPPGQDASETYREAYARIKFEPIIWESAAIRSDQPVFRVIEDGWNPQVTEVVAWLEGSRPALPLARRAASLPRIGEHGFDPLAVQSDGPPVLNQLQTLASLLGVSSREQMARGDLEGAWGDILAQLRMAGQLVASAPTTVRTLRSCQIHHQGVGLALDWLSDPRQTPELIRQARADLKAIPPPPTLEPTLRAESHYLDRLLELSDADLYEMVNPRGKRRDIESSHPYLVNREFFDTPWERERTRRLCRRLFTEAIAEARQEPWQRTDDLRVRSAAIVGELQGTPIAQIIFPATETVQFHLDRELANRRALDLALAIRSYQLGHGGESPATLDALVPGELDRLPVDPYSGKPFGYVQALGQSTRPPIQSDFGRSPVGNTDFRPTQLGQPLLYSVGPDRVDNRASRSANPSLPGITGDLIVPLPGTFPQ